MNLIFLFLIHFLLTVSF